jgi:antitoxin (DNA-binding transcriptional repressor) of toxin-antitoxin stability system
VNVPIAEAKAKFSELIKRVEAGEDVLLTRDGKVIARLTLPENPRPERKSLIGAYKGKFWMADDFDELGPEWDEYM